VFHLESGYATAEITLNQFKSCNRTQSIYAGNSSGWRPTLYLHPNEGDEKNSWTLRW